MKKMYKVVANCSYRDRQTKYVCGEFSTLREARKYIKDNCQDSVSRSYYIE